MKYKLIALDIDDTIVQEASHIPSQKVMDALLQISKKIHVIISTARARSEFEVFKKNIGLPPNYNIVENGAKVLSPDGKVEYELTIPHNEIQKILNITEPYFDEVGFCIDENWDNEIRDTKDKAVNALSYTCTDSATALYLLKNTMPIENIYVVHLYYFENSIPFFKKTIDPLGLPKENVLLYPIKKSVDRSAETLGIKSDDGTNNKVRLGNIMARTRMIYLFDQAKKLDALVCGTENRTENLLGYFTRFGDAASDFEIINHLFKTEVRALARYLKVPDEIISASPTAGLWEGQTDEKEIGFTYSEIDCVLKDYFDKKIQISDIEKKGKNARAILDMVNRNLFKHEVPYVMDITT